MTSPITSYITDETLHKGARCVVYRAHIKDDETSVILKVLRAVPAPAPEVARFRREYEFTHSLNLPCVVGCHEIRTGGDRNFMVLEDFGGQSLNRLAVGRIDLSTFLEIAHASSAALATIHERNVVHGNLCPSNIVFNIHTGQLKLIDFGCAVDLWEEYPTGSIPCEGVEMAYASPEQVGFSSETDPYPVIDSRSDLYSLGVTLYHLLTGRLPVAVGKPGENGASPASDTLDGGNDKDAGRKDIGTTAASSIVHGPSSAAGAGPQPPHQIREGIPRRLSEILLRLIEKDPNSRYRSAAELTADLATIRMSELTKLSRKLASESTRRKQALLDLQEAYEEVQVQEEGLREQQEELIATRAQVGMERQHYQELFALAPDGYMVTDLRGIIFEANQAATALLGVDPRFVRGSLLVRFVPTREERRDFYNFLRRVRQSYVTEEWEGRLAPLGRHGQEPVDVVVRCSAIRDAAGLATQARWLIRDVTAKKRAEEAMRLSEERFRALAESGRDVTYRITFVPSRAVDYISPSVTALTGFAPEELYANPNLASTLAAPENRQVVEAMLSDPEKWVGPQVMRWQHKDGSDIWTEHTNAPIYDGEGRVVGFTGVARDITARMRAEQAIEERDLLIEKITTTAPHLIYVFDLAARRTIYTNGKVAEVFGYPLEEGRSLGWHDALEIIHTDDKPRATAYIEGVAAAVDNGLPPIEVRMLDAEGHYRWITAHYVVLTRNPDGTPAQILGTLANITQRKEMENALRESEARFRTSVESLQDAFGIFSAVRDDAGNLIDFKIEYLNPVASFISQMSAEEQVGHTLHELLQEERWPMFFEEYRQVVETGEPRKFESETYDGLYGQQHIAVAIDISAARLGDGFIAIWRDVTERKKREELLREREHFIQHVAGVTPGVIFVYDMIERRVLYVNDQVTSVTGLTPQQLEEIGSTLHEALNYGDSNPRPEVLQERIMQARDGEVVEFEIKLSHLDGSSRWLLTRAVVFVRDEAGAPRQILAVAYDISERKQIEETVRQANEDLYARVGELSALSKISQILANRTDLTLSLAAVCKTLLDILEASEASISEFAPSRSDLTVLAHVQRDRGGPDIIGRTFALSEDPLARRAISEDQPVLIFPDAESLAEAGRMSVGEKGSGVRDQGLAPAYDPDPQPLIPDSLTDPQPEWMYGSDTQSLIVLPLRSRGSIMGLLSIARNGEGTGWSPADVRLAQTVAGTLATAIVSTRLFNEELKQRLLAESLNEVGTALTGSLDLETVLHTIFEQLKRVVDYDGAALFLRDGDDLVETQAVGISARYMGYRLSTDSKGAQMQVLQTGQPWCISDTHDYMDWAPPGANKQVQSWMGAPLIIGDSILGILTVSHKRRNTYNDIHLHVLQSFANEAAIAINNATRYRDAQDVATYEERNRLARELHDSVTQSLFSANLVAKVLPDLAQRNPAKFDKALETLARLTESALAEMRTMLLELRSGSLTQTPLDVAFTSLKQMITSRSSLDIVHTTFDLAPILPEDVQLALYRIVQETLANVEKHAKAQHVEFDLRVLPPFHRSNPHHWKGEITIHIADDGKGFDIHTTPPGHLGLQIMRERAASIGANLEITSETGRGTQMTITWTGELDVPQPETRKA